MPFAKKRKISETSDHPTDTQTEPATTDTITPADNMESEEVTTFTEVLDKDSMSSKNEGSESTTAMRDREERRERFKALQIRAVSRVCASESFLLQNSGA